jgi:hypothetical protein
MRQVRTLVILTATATLVACAAQPPTVPALPPAAATTSTPAKSSAHSGYTRVVSRDGTELFCRNDDMTGSRVQHQKVCLTEAQLQADEQNGQSFLNGVESRSVGAAGSGH